MVLPSAAKSIANGEILPNVVTLGWSRDCPAHWKIQMSRFFWIGGTFFSFFRRTFASKFLRKGSLVIYAIGVNSHFPISFSFWLSGCLPLFLLRHVEVKMNTRDLMFEARLRINRRIKIKWCIFWKQLKSFISMVEVIKTGWNPDAISK